MIRIEELASRYGFEVGTLKHLLWRMSKRLPENHRPIRRRGYVDEGSFKAALVTYGKLTNHLGRRRDANGQYIAQRRLGGER